MDNYLIFTPAILPPCVVNNDFKKDTKVVKKAITAVFVRDIQSIEKMSPVTKISLMTTTNAIKIPDTNADFTSNIFTFKNFDIFVLLFNKLLSSFEVKF